ncbi:VrrA protein product [Bacillus pseudomycoides]|uniref:VrrA protein product n=1 Tax=Bacillus pseudomycoides TaxID=64104 RepID=A0AA91ZUJ8_9BACI|nr:MULTISPECIES: VrrA/YqfQ family protein [Bacillus]PEB53377.1 VrrA protein product [Bacillus sp. AFS098217]PED83754.1 VrrA protein product [Bacillus pseudomycoides]PEU14776.1 VrrA protein product [Bacillus sp. AFS019443]PEU19472.1 VrrA protein product [Bacillus sp. AFS014408]PFW64447.1 VrrA protein product [Bacillus sp. AFS075034]
MYPKSPMQQMYPGQQPYTPYPIPQLPPMMQKKKGFLSKLFKKHDPTQPFMQMVPPYRQMEGQPIMHQHPHHQQYHQSYIQQPQQMIPPQPQMMNEPNEMRGGASVTPSASSGIGSFFSNLISNPTGMLNNIEKVAQVAQSVGPVVEQYGPIVRSIPSIVKILTSGKGEAEESKDEVEVITTPSPPKKKKRKEIILDPLVEKELPEENIPHMATKPKLYV